MNKSDFIRNQDAFFILMLGTLAWLSFGNALKGNWRQDDGDHLFFVMNHGLAALFFDRDTLSGFSGANLTPWNPFFYAINLKLFGWAVTPAYAHLLLILLLTAMLTYIFLRRVFPGYLAFFGSAIFIGGAPTYYVSQFLMTAHYAFGLLLSVLVILFYKEKGRVWYWIGPFLFGLACLCKEVYVPLVMVLPLLDEGNTRSRLKKILPYAGVAAGYFTLRWYALGTLVGGYGMRGVEWSSRLQQLLQIPFLLFGSGLSGGLATGAAATALVWLFIKQRRHRLLMLAGFVIIVGPLIPLTAFPGIRSADRYLFAFWWLLSIALAGAAFQISKLRNGFLWTICFCGLIAAATFSNHQDNRAIVDVSAHQDDALFRFVAAQNSNQYLLPPEVAPGYYEYTLSNFMRAYQKYTRSDKQMPHILANYHDDLALLPARIELWTYDAKCQCMKDVSQGLTELRAQGQRLFASHVEGKRLAVDVRYGNGRMHWRFECEDSLHSVGGFRFVDRDGHELDLAAEGSFALSRAHPLEFRVDYSSDEGWIASTPYFKFDPKNDSIIAWRGLSQKPDIRRAL